MICTCGWRLRDDIVDEPIVKVVAPLPPDPRVDYVAAAPTETLLSTVVLPVTRASAILFAR